MDDFNGAILIGRNIKRARERKNWSQKDLEGRCGIVNTQISAYETGKKEPNLHSLAILAKALDISMDELYWGDGNISFLNTAPDEGWQIVNSIFKLQELNVIKRDVTSPHLNVCKHWNPIMRFLESLQEFDLMRETYSDPDSYLEILKGSIAKQINSEIENDQVTKLSGPVVAPSTMYK